MVMLEDHHELMRNLAHYVQDVVREPVSLTPLLQVDPLHLADDLPQPLLELAVVAPRFVGDYAAFELAGLLPHFSPIADDVYINFSQRIFSANALQCHFDDFSAGVGGDRARGYYNGQILLRNSQLLALHCLKKL